MKSVGSTEDLFKANLALARGETSAAARLFQELLSVDETLVGAWIGLGMAQSSQRNFQDALNSLLKAESFDCANPLLYQAKADLFAREGNFIKALEAFDLFIKSYPECADAWYGMGHCFWMTGYSDKAIFCLNNACNLDGKSTNAFANNLLAHIYLSAGKVDLAAKCIKYALIYDPLNIIFLLTDYEVKLKAGRNILAEQSLKLILDLHPESVKARSARLMGIKYDINASMQDIYRLSCEWDYFVGTGVEVVSNDFAQSSGSAVKLRIGYVSPDFNLHSVGIIIHALLCCHDRNRLEIFCYSCSKKQDLLTNAIKSRIDVWRDVTDLSDSDAAAMIAADNLDYLVDLAGHSAESRLGVFTRRPARNQLSWLGFAHTTGLAAMDLFVTDSISVLPDEDGFFSEKIERLPVFRIPFVQPDVSPEVVEAPYLGNGYITFGSFNNVAKLNDAVISAWADILNAVPKSRLLLKWKSFASRSVREMLFRKFAHYGVERNRVELRSESGHYFMLMEYGDIDIALDPFPFSGCVTTYNAFWMGVPVVTLKGKTPISRQTAAINSELGLDTLTTESVAEYVRVAVLLARDKERISALRESLRGTLSSSRLADLGYYAHLLESIYQTHALPAKSVALDYTVLEQTAECCVDAGFSARGAEIIKYLQNNGHKSVTLSRLNAMVLYEKGFRAKAVRSLERLAAKSYDEKLLFVLSNAYKKQFLIYPAIHCLNQILERNPNFDRIRFDLASLLINSGRSDDGCMLLKDALSRNKKSITAIAGYLFALNYSDSISAEQIYSEYLKYGSVNCSLSGNRKKWRNEINKDRRLRIGYVSPDFGTHPVTFFLLEVFKYHSRDTLEIFCYSSRSKDDDLTCYFRDCCHHWRQIFKSSARDVASIIRSDGIDILIDLSGYTKDNRLDVFRLKAAPVQISWLGYPNTTGIPTIDYRITDAIADPPGKSDDIHTEKLVRLPGSFLCFYPPPLKIGLTVAPFKKSGVITFGSFNNLAKITPSLIKLWSDILLQVNDSKLLIKRDIFTDPLVKSFFVDSFLANGVTADRLNLVVHKQSTYSHMSEYNNVDIALDSFPYNGTTTTCEALWMGVPVVTLAGDRHAARVGASILTNVGLPELVAYSSNQYVDIAVDLANDHERREHLRKSIRPKMSASILMDGARFTRNLENAYRDVWGRWCDQQSRVIQ